MKIEQQMANQNIILNLKQNTSIKKRDQLKQKKTFVEPQSAFEELLFEVVPPQKEPELFQLWSILPDVEKKLIQNPNEENLEEYKNIVKNIAKQLLEKNIKTIQIKKRSSSGKEIILTYTKIIDEKLHKMMLAIQSKRNTAFEILRNLKEIRGILIDLKQ